MKIFVLFICVALAFCACHHSSNKKQSQVPTEPLDTIKTVPAIMSKPALFEKAFIKGTTEIVMKSKLYLYGVTIGKLKISSGKIVACDPMLIEEYGKPFMQTFPTGEFPVQLSIAKLGDAETVAYARVNFSEEPVARWEYALLEREKQAPLGSKTDHGYVVDAGVGCFMDKAATDSLLKQGEGYQAALYAEWKKHFRPSWKHAIYNVGSNNLASFSAGFGDGRYVTYIGYDAAGKMCRLLTDFKVCDWTMN